MSEEHVRSAIVTWEGGMRFRGGTTGGPVSLIDADGVEAPGPMVALLLASVACAGADIVSILQKMQVTLREFTTEASGRRAPEHPKRYLTMHFKYRMVGDGLDEAKARRAIDLSHQKYCSVLHSLNSDIAITYEISLG
ncbi:MAG TPA: OsmC family protein [Gemmatimonadales bacterium]|nr:OsmC family protein [Gemmatimonadales bacterium]